MNCVLDIVENIAWKNDVYPRCLIFLQCLQKPSTLESLKVRIIWGKINFLLNDKALDLSTMKHIATRYLTHSLIRHFETIPNSKKLQTTTEIWLLKDFRYTLHRKHCGKNVKLLIAPFEQIHLFPQCFSIALFMV